MPNAAHQLRSIFSLRSLPPPLAAGAICPGTSAEAPVQRKRLWHSLENEAARMAEVLERRRLVSIADANDQWLLRLHAHVIDERSDLFESRCRGEGKRSMAERWK